MLGWSTLAYLRVPWAEVAPSPCQHPLTLFKCQERDSASCQHTSSVEAWGDKEPMQHWAEGGEQFQCLSQGCWEASLPVQFWGFPLILSGCDTEHQQGAGKTGQHSQPPNTSHPLFERLKSIAIPACAVPLPGERFGCYPLKHSPSHWVF